MSRTSLTSLTQIATAVARLLGYSYVIGVLGRKSENSQLLLAIGYLPFLAFVDVLVQSFSRARYVSTGQISSIVERQRRPFAISSLFLISGLALMAGSPQPIKVSWVLVATYALGGVAYFWERFSSEGHRPIFQSLLEISIITLGVAACYFSSNLTSQVSLLALMSFPLARLLLITAPEIALECKTDNKPRAAHVGRYIAFSLAQQVVGAVSAALPSIYSSLSGDASALARNLIAFRLIHSAAALASMVVNSMGARIFYANIGQGFEGFERRVANLAKPAGFAVFSIGALAVMATPWAPLANIPISGLMVLMLILFNLLSSLLINRGMPGLSLLCQLQVLFVSVGLIFLLNGHSWLFCMALAITLLVFFSFKNMMFSAYLSRLSH